MKKGIIAMLLGSFMSLAALTTVSAQYYRHDHRDYNGYRGHHHVTVITTRPEYRYHHSEFYGPGHGYYRGGTYYGYRPYRPYRHRGGLEIDFHR